MNVIDLGHSQPSKYSGILYLLLAIVNLSLAACKTVSKESEIREFENSSDICLAINKAGGEVSLDEGGRRDILGRHPELSQFTKIKNRERQILEDLIVKYGQMARQKAVVVGESSPIIPSSDVVLTDEGEEYGPDSRIRRTPFTTANEVCSAFRDERPMEFKALSHISRHDRIPPRDAREIASRYCHQLKEVRTCEFTANQSRPCLALGKDRPPWVTERCEVAEAAIQRGAMFFGLEACGAIAKIQTGGGIGAPAACSMAAIGQVCNAGVFTANGLLNHFRTIAGTQEDIGLKAMTRLLTTFERGVLNCLTNVGVDSLKKALAESAKTGLAQTAKAHWAKFVLGKSAAKEILENGHSFKKPTAGELAKKIGVEVVKQAAAAACSVAAEQIAAKFDAIPEQIDNQCAPRTESETSSRIAACFRTAGSACRAGVGIVDFQGIVQAKSPGGKVGAEMANAAAYVGCGALGNLSKAACGVLSEATKQIIAAVKTGDNDWARCAGTTRMGGCIGQSWAEWQAGRSRKATNTPVAEPRVSNGQTTRVCCHCLRDWYQDDWGSNTKFRTDHIGSVTSFVDGMDQSDCTSLQKGRQWQNGIKRNGYKVYYKNRSCKQVKVFGSRCEWGLDSGYGDKSARIDRKGVNFEFGRKRQGRGSYRYPKGWSRSPVTFHMGTLYCLDGKC